MRGWRRWLRILPSSVWWTLAGVGIGFAVVWTGSQPHGVYVCRQPQGAATTFISYHWSWVGWGRCVVVREEPVSPKARIFRESSRLDCQRLQKQLEADGAICQLD